ncbi:MAG TPA: ERCC4 domain-containing protein [Candidatus Pacearchaeota archaeon]|nr:ERCC4 domain-containing protein [Candidatus Pacearchaeota archaeon]
MENSNFLQIFSKKKEQYEEIKLPKVIVDYREKNSFVPANLLKLGVEIEFKELKVADYLANGIAIERKTVSDFISSMINKRLISQLEGLKQYESPLLVIEGIYEQELYSDNCNSGVHANSIRGFLISILIKHKIPILFTKNPEDTARFIFTMLQRKEKENSLNISRKSLNKNEQIQFIIEGFPGIGPKTAKKLLEEFKTIKNIVNASQEQLQKVIGKKADVFKLSEQDYSPE